MPNFRLTQDWVGYLSRSYAQVKQSVISRLVTSNPEITDHTESNILIILISMFAGIAEMLNLYIDRMGQEAFMGTARKFSSVLNLAKLVDYRAKASIASVADIVFTVVDTNTLLPTPTTSAITIGAGTVVSTPNGLTYDVIKPIVIAIGETYGYTSCIQSILTNTTIGTTSGVANQQVPLPIDYVHKSLTLDINSDIWVEVDSLGLANATDKVFIVDLLEDGNPYVIFGDGVNGGIPAAAQVIDATYSITNGELGNVLPNVITNIVTNLTIPVGLSLKVTNPTHAISGSGPEDIEQIRSLAPRSIRTVHRAVTYQDYIDLALLVPGVGAAAVRYCCGECVKVYIAPLTQGIANTSLLSTVKSDLDCKRMVGRCVTVLAAGITRVWLKLTIKAKYGVSLTQAELDFRTGMIAQFGYNNSDINRQIYLSDIIAAIDNISTLDYVNIAEIWAEPYARPIGSALPLQWVPVILSGSIQIHTWFIKYEASSTAFRIYKNGISLPTLAYTGVPYVDPDNIITFTIQSFAYTDGDRWDFTTYPTGVNLPINDNTVPILDIDPAISGPMFLDLTIEQTLTQTTCTPSC